MTTSSTDKGSPSSSSEREAVARIVEPLLRGVGGVGFSEAKAQEIAAALLSQRPAPETLNQDLAEALAVLEDAARRPDQASYLELARKDAREVLARWKAQKLSPPSPAQDVDKEGGE